MSLISNNLRKEAVTTASCLFVWNGMAISHDQKEGDDSMKKTND